VAVAATRENDPRLLSWVLPPKLIVEGEAVLALNPSVIAWLATHHGVITTPDLLRFGVTPRQIVRLVRTGLFVPYTRCVHRLAAAPVTAEQAMALACAVSPDVVVSHRSAGRIWGLRRLGPDRRLHVTLTGTVNRRIPGAVVHWSHHIDAVDIVERADGIRVTSPPRTAFDLAWTLSDEQLESIFEQLLHEKFCTVPTMYDTGRRLREKGRNGSARYARVVQSRPAWVKPTGSDLELIFERALVAAGLPRPVRQHAIEFADGEIIHPDFYWPDHAEVAEIDHITWHGGKLETTEDKRRDRKMWREHRIHSNRVTDHDIKHNLAAVVDDFRAILTPSRAS
jgi:hypothetical protein